MTQNSSPANAQNTPAAGANPNTTTSEPPTREPVFSLGRFESNCYARKHEPAAREFMALLSMLDRNYGALDPGFEAKPTANLGGADQDPHIISRICSALSALFSDPSFNLSFDGFRQMIYLHRWIATLFAASPFKNADHILRSLNLKGPNANDVEIQSENIVKFYLLFTPNSEISINLDALWALNKNLCAALCCALVSPRFLGTVAAHHKREVILKWLPPRLDAIEDLDVLPVGVLHDVYMHCSYADLPSRHEIKGPINRLVRKKVLQLGFNDLSYKPKPKSKKPVMLVILEWFSGAHSVYRTHSASMRGCQERFHLVGIGMEMVDDLGVSVFDEFERIKNNDNLAAIRQIRETVVKHKPEVIYYPAIGMFPLTIFLSNQRLAPLQVTSLGHAATTFSPFIDYFIVDEDFYGDADTFTEKLISMPVNGMPHVPSALLIKKTPLIRDNPDEIRIAIPSTTMKLNPRFLTSCRNAINGSKIKLRFEFFMGLSRGLVSLEVRQLVSSYIPDAVIHPSRHYHDYLEGLNQCDMFINPYPYGNMNSIVDVTTLGLAGVCKTGPALHEHIDDGMFRRLKMPEWLIAKTDDEYVQAVIRLANDHEERINLRKRLLSDNSVQVMFDGLTDELGKRILNLIGN